jgi:hypothetical protein
MKTLKFLLAILFSIAVVACGGGGSSSGGTTPTPTPAPATSSSSSSGAIGVYTNNGATYALTPAAAPAGVGTGTANLLTLPNSGTMVGVATVAHILKTPIATSLKDASGAPAAISGTSLDPANDLGIAFNYYISKISLFKLSTKTEIATYDAKTLNLLGYSGASSVMIAGAVMNPANKTIILATADGLQIVDYTTPTAPTLKKTIPSLAINATTGVEIMENFAFDPALPSGSLIITGGNQSSTDPVMVLVDEKTGTVYRPDTATAALFTVSSYIDSAAVDTNYHVVILADESTGTTFVDLNKLTLNPTAGTYSLPSAAVNRIITYNEMDNLGVESTNHLVMMGAGFGGTSTVVAHLSAPSTALNFDKQVVVTMPSGNDDQGNAVTWFGGYDPHTAGAYLSDSTSPIQPSTSRAIWLSGDGTHIADINLLNVLNGALANPSTYNPMAATPQDIAYFNIP